ncbi:Serine/threonine-protein kinase smg1 [Physocladia obscura]|uniref:Serine/threonine-protein kinase smg1 n=1 Tax=Physocladia obscura TaxID=109957 RepID=A0AAD5SUB3_9FUNG|nr:Serine/threonine-protein kinase smg1 [Physocladia obscura]
MTSLVMFIDMLELQIQNAIGGTAANLPTLPKQVAAFFLANRSVCDKWFSRIRTRLVESCYNCQNVDHILIHNALESLNSFDLSNLKENRGDIDSIVTKLGAAFVSIQDSDSLVGLSSWIRKCSLWDDVKLQWVKSFANFANGEYESGLHSINAENIDYLQYPVLKTILKANALNDDLGLYQILQDNFDFLQKPLANLEKWIIDDPKKSTRPLFVESVVALAIRSNSVHALPQNFNMQENFSYSLINSVDKITETILSDFSYNSATMQEIMNLFLDLKLANSIKRDLSVDKIAALKELIRKLLEVSAIPIEGKEIDQVKATLEIFKAVSKFSSSVSLIQQSNNLSDDVVSAAKQLYAGSHDLLEKSFNNAIETVPNYSKAWFLGANFWYLEGLKLIEEIRGGSLQKVCSILLVELDCFMMAQPKNAAFYTAGLLKQNVASEFLAIASEATDAIFETLEFIRKKVLLCFEKSVVQYHQFLVVDSFNAKPERKKIVVLRIIQILSFYATDLSGTLKTVFAESPTESWTSAVSQLFACLSHSNPIVITLATSLLCRIACDYPLLIVYNCVVGSKSAKALKSPLLKDAYCKIVSQLNLEYSENVSALLDEFKQTTVLWEEMWFNKLGHLNSEAPKRLHQFNTEYLSMKSNPTSKAIVSIEEKYEILIHPVVSSLEKLARQTIETAVNTPHKAWFTAKYKETIIEALRCLKYPQDLSSTKKLWSPFFEIMNNIAKDFQQNKSLSLYNLSPKLEFLGHLLIPMPSSGKSSELRIQGFSPSVTVLPTKTKPKKIEIIASDGHNYSFLFKGLEDLRLDERIQSLLQVANNLLKIDKNSQLRNLSARTYDVFPLGDQFGMIEWIENVPQLFSIYKRWQIRDFGARNNINKEATPVMLRPHEIFHSKLSLALKKNGISRNSPRHEWPNFILRSVFEDLVRETPKNLIKNELWMSSPSTSEWWKKTLNFSRSVGVTSILGYLIGLGDRHLDNMMLDTKTGEIVHIDYNVCFEKGRRLRVPETVPFRLTQNIIEAMGVTGIDGPFKIACETTLQAIKDRRDCVLAILNSFVYDPIVDWALNEEEADERLLLLNLNLKLMKSRISENMDEIQDSSENLFSHISKFLTEFQKFSMAAQTQIYFQGHIDFLSAEMKKIDSGQLFVNIKQEETEALFQVQTLSNDSALWHSRHQMALATIVNPQIDSYLSGLNFSSVTIAENLAKSSISMRSIINFDEKLLNTVQKRSICLNILFQRIKAYHLLVAPILSTTIGQDFRHRIVLQLGQIDFSQSSLDKVRSELLFEDALSSSKQLQKNFADFEQLNLSKMKEASNLKKAVALYSETITEELVITKDSEYKQYVDQFSEKEGYLEIVESCIIVKGVEILGSALFALLKSHDFGEIFNNGKLKQLTENSVHFGPKCAFQPENLAGVFCTIQLVNFWMHIVADSTIQVSDAFEIEVLQPLEVLVSIAQTLEEFQWQILAAVPIALRAVASGEGSIPTLLSQLEGFCLPFSMISDKRSREFQLHSVKLRDDFKVLSQIHGHSAAGAFIASLNNVFMPMENQIVKLLSAVVSNEDEVLQNILFVDRILIYQSLLSSFIKYANSENLLFSVWKFETLDFKKLLTEPQFSNDGEYIPKCFGKFTDSSVPKGGFQQQQLKNVCTSFLNGAYSDGVVQRKDVENFKKAIWEICELKVAKNIIERGQANITRQDWNLNTFAQTMNRFQYVHERSLYRVCKVKNIREEVIMEFRKCLPAVEEVLAELRKLSNELPLIAEFDNEQLKSEAAVRYKLLQDEIERVSRQSLVDFEMSRIPDPTLYAPIQAVLAVVTKMEILAVRKAPTKQKYANLIKSLQIQLDTLSNYNWIEWKEQFGESLKELMRLYDSGKHVLKRFNSSIDRVARCIHDVKGTESLQKQLKLFWVHWPHLGSKIRKWITEVNQLIAVESYSADVAENLMRKFQWLSEGVSISLKKFAILLDELQEVKVVVPKFQEIPQAISKNAEVDEDGEDETEDVDDQAPSEDEEDGDEEERQDKVEEGSQKAQMSAAVAKATKGTDRNGETNGERNVYALNILKRVQEKLNGLDGAQGKVVNMTVTEQIGSC